MKRLVYVALAFFFGCNAKNVAVKSCGDANLLVQNPSPHLPTNPTGPDRLEPETVDSFVFLDRHSPSYYDSVGAVAFMLGEGAGLDLDLIPNQKVLSFIVKQCKMKDLNGYAVHSLHGPNVDYLYFFYKHGLAKRKKPNTLDGRCEPSVQLDKKTGEIQCIECRFCRDGAD